MPEGPEVKLICDGFKHYLLYSYLQQFNVLGGQFLKDSKKPLYLQEFQNSLPLKILDAQTHGKFMWINFEHNWSAMVTFGMSGNFRLHNSNLKHAHLELISSNGQKIYYHDIRRFGSWNFVKTDGKELNQKIQNLGLDILTPQPYDKNHIFQAFYQKNKYQNWQIASALMSQEILAGVGAYITAESLYYNRIHPHLKVKDLSQDDLFLLYQSIFQLAHQAYQDGGASLYTYTGIQGDQSNFKEQLQIYAKSHDPFGYPVHSIKISGGRSIQYVPDLQISNSL